MIGYTMVGTNDLEKSGAFYDAVLAPLDASRSWVEDAFIVWSVGGDMNGGTSFSITLPYDGKPASVGNGSMIALAAASTDMVDKIYDIAMTSGAADEGAPGYRGDPAGGFYAAYFRDLDGNKLNTFCIAPKK